MGFQAALHLGRVDVLGGGFDQSGLGPDEGERPVRLDAAELTDIVFDLQTPMTLLTAGSLRMQRGMLGHFLDWWVVLRSLIDGVPVHTSGSIAFRDRQGGPLDLHTAFAIDDDPEEVARWLTERHPDKVRCDIAPDISALAVDPRMCCMEVLRDQFGVDGA